MIGRLEELCWRWRWCLGLLWLGIAASLPMWGLSRVQLRLILMIALYAMLGMGLDLLVGDTGLVSLGHAGFYALGAYGCALLQVRLGWSFWAALAGAGVLTAGVGLLLGLPSLRLSGSYLSIVTLGFGEIVQMVLRTWESLTGGNYGLRGIPRPTLFGLELTLANGGLPALALILATLTALFCRRLRRSAPGRALRAIRDDPLAAQMCGIPVPRWKIAAFVLSALITGLAGGFYSAVNGYLEPTNFPFNTSVVILSVVVIGGAGTVRGAVFGAALVQLLPQVFRGLEQWRFALYGLLLVLVMRFRPQGVLGWRSRVSYRLPGKEGQCTYPAKG